MPVDRAFDALLADPRMALREPPPHVTVEMLRQACDAGMAQAVGPAVHAVDDRRIDGPGGPIPIRIYRGSAEAGPSAILFIHGGGFVFGSIATHDALCRKLALWSGAVVIALDYRLAPEAAFPAPLDDCVAALQWMRAEAAALGIDPARIAIVGDSAGGQLAIATAMTAAEGAGHVGVFYPLLDPSCQTASARAFGEGFVLTRSFVQWCWRLYGASAGAASHPLFDLTRANLAGIRSATVITAEYDPLRDEGEAFAERLRASGAVVTCHRYDGMIHGFAGLADLTSEANRAIHMMARACCEALVPA